MLAIMHVVDCKHRSALVIVLLHELQLSSSSLHDRADPQQSATAPGELHQRSSMHTWMASALEAALYSSTA
jgi:hypothetical protein